MEGIALIIGIGTGVVSLTTALIGVAAYLKSSATKEYAAQRDFGHLKKSYEQLVQNTEQLWRQNDERLDRVDRQLDRIETHLTGRVKKDTVIGDGR